MFEIETLNAKLVGLILLTTLVGCSDGMKALNFSATQLLQSSTKATASITPTSLVCGADVVNNPNVDASKSLQACMNNNVSLIELVPGRYFLENQITLHSRANLTVRTQNVTSGAGCLQTGAANCAILTAAKTFNGSTILYSSGSNHLSLQYFALDGNNSVNRAARDPSTPAKNFPYNAAIQSCDTCSFVGFASVRSPWNSGLTFFGDNAVFDHCLFKDNGWGARNSDIATSWSDGLTIGSAINIQITNSIFKDNSDINVILGNAPNARIQNNWIGNQHNFAFGGLMLDNFNNSSAGDFTDAVVSNNTIDCGQGMCGIGIMVGPHIWYNSNPVLGGLISENSVSGAMQGILTSGSNGAEIANNTVSIVGHHIAGSFATNFISWSPGDNVNIHDNNVAAVPSQVVGMGPMTLPTMFSEYGGINPAVSQSYNEILGREPELIGGQAFTHALNIKTMSIDEIRGNIAYSNEALVAINAIYLLVLGRNVDSGSVQTYRDYLRKGGSLARLYINIQQSPEGQTQSFALESRN